MINSVRRLKHSITLVLFCAQIPGSYAADVFPHETWTAVLTQHVDSNGMVDYVALAADRSELDRYLDSIREAGPESTPAQFDDRSAELAYYINAYNALVFEGVLARGPEKKSVWRGLISGFNFFVRMKLVLDGNTTNLKSLEDDIIRKKFLDPRVHAALNCASIGCPRLPREAFNGDQLDEQLDNVMHEFVADPRHVRIDAADGIVYLSKIFDWFEEDFIEFEERGGNVEVNLLDYVNRYREGGEKVSREMKVKFLDYDKGINSQR